MEKRMWSLDRSVVWLEELRRNTDQLNLNTQQLQVTVHCGHGLSCFSDSWHVFR